MEIDWHSDPLDADTKVDASFRKTQNVRRTLTTICGPDFKFDRPLMAWIDEGNASTIGEIAEEWRRRRA